MTLGGGTVLKQNKVSFGSYINFVSTSRATEILSERGYAAMPLILDWGVDGEVFKVEADSFQRDSLKIFGYDSKDEKLKGLRDLFRHIRAGYFYKLNTGQKASCKYATAKYTGARGNDLKIVIIQHGSDASKFDVQTFLGTNIVDSQTVSSMAELIANDFVDFIVGYIALTRVIQLIGGANGENIAVEDYRTFMDKIENYSFNALGCLETSPEVTDLFVEFTKRMRDKWGVKFQTILYRTPADYEGIINVQNDVVGEITPSALVYWVTGISAGCRVNKSNTNKVYDGELTVNVDFRQSELEAAISEGKFILHRVGADIHILEDINCFVSYTDDKNRDFGRNQTVRVLDQIANDIAVLFNTKYNCNVPNDVVGRISFWNDVVKHHQELQSIRAIENFKPEDVVIAKGNSKRAIVIQDAVTIMNSMKQLYMTTVVR